MTRITGALGVAILSAALLVSPAAAWEFTMTQTFNWNYYSGDQIGTDGFFGRYDVDAAGVGAGNANFWGGIDKLNGTFSGSNAHRQTMFMEFTPEFRVNDAVKVKGVYRIGSWIPAGNGVTPIGTPSAAQAPFLPNIAQGGFGGAFGNPVGSEYDNSTFPGATVSFSPGYWEELWLAAHTPWGLVVVGKRPFIFGIGTFCNGQDNTTSERLLIEAPYGPLTVGIEISAARPLLDTEPTLNGAPTAGTPAGVPIPVAPIPPPGGNPNYTGVKRLTFGYDGSFLRNPDVAAFVRYDAATLSTGFLYDYMNWSVGPESRGGTTALQRTTNQSLFIPRDFEAQWGIAYMKYANCRFFLNAEFDFFYSTVRNKPNLLGTDYVGLAPFVTNVAGAGSVYRPKYTEMERYAVETGVTVGPSKLSCMGARIPGFDRRHGTLIDRQPNGMWVGPENMPDALMPLHPEYSNTGFFNPYSYLMVFSYGGGLGALDNNADGMLVDANALGVRLDYAVAANLNLWGSAFYAERVSHGYGWGYITPNVNGGTPGNDGSSVIYNVPMSFSIPDAGGAIPPIPASGTFANPSPAIPDRSLGYEFGGGLDWQLLEGLRFNARASYWLPGKWFNHACVSRANPFWNTPSLDPTGQFGTQPNRNISSVFGLQFQVVGEF